MGQQATSEARAGFGELSTLQQPLIDLMGYSGKSSIKPFFPLGRLEQD